MKQRSQNVLLYVLICVALAFSVFVVYAPVRRFAFVRLDDGEYVVRNEHVNTGITGTNIIWAFTRYHSNNWHPLTWLSHMLDCQLFGLNPGYHHITSVVIHGLNAILLFIIFARCTGNMGSSALIAALFALHPTHVESVAWISERKDVLSTFFWIITLGAYFSYTKEPNKKRYILTLCLFLLGIMSKPMVVTLPVTLLLMDIWPLERIHIPVNKRTIYPLVIEKVPFFMLSFLSCGVTLFVQRDAGPSMEQMPFLVRLTNALLAYMRYIGKLVWPVHLSVLYPHSHQLPRMWQMIATVLILLVVFCLVLRFIRKYPYLSVGWFWYIVTLLPVIGVIQVGNQSLADRYTYIPYIGLFFIIAWGLPEWMPRSRAVHRLFAVCAVIVLILLGCGARHQVAYWQDSISLFEHACEVTQNNRFMQECTARVYRSHGRIDQAVAYFKACLQTKPEQPAVLNSLAWIFATADDAAIRDPGQAIAYAAQACSLTGYKDPLYLDTLAAAYASAGRFADAIELMDDVLRLSPQEPYPEYQQRLALYKQHRAYTEPLLPETDICEMFGEQL